jgi:molecular chaperone GrpE
MMDETKLDDTTNQAPAFEAATDSVPETAAKTGQDAAPDAAAEAALPDYAAQISELENALAQERERADKLLDQSQRMAAEFQNSRRRLENQVQEEIERASNHLVRRLLPVIDDFDLAFAHVPAEIEGGAAWVEGFRQIQKKLHNVLAEEGVEMIRGEGEFDPTLHEAVSAEASDEVATGHIIATLRAGYTHKGKVLRPALVRVAT